MKNIELKDIEMLVEDLKNTIKIFKNNKYAINTQIDILITALEQLKLK